MNCFLCVRCGIILRKYSDKPSFCPKCGGVSIEDIGEEGSFDYKEIKKEFRFPYRPDKYYDNPA